MGDWYWRQIQNEWDIAEGSTDRFDLPEKGHVSALAIQLIGENNANLSDYPRPYPIQRITKLRIVGNGSEELINLEARYLQACNFWDWGQQPEGIYTLGVGAYQRNFFIVPFGRVPLDEKYGLILDKYKAGVQFEVTNDLSTTYHKDGKTRFNIIAIMRKNPEAGLFSGGFLKKRQVFDRDALTATQYPVRLPTESKLRQIYIFSEPDISSYVDATSATTNVRYIWLGIKSREDYIINNIRTIDWVSHIHNLAKRMVETSVSGYSAGAASTAYKSYMDTMIYRRPHQLISAQAPGSADNSVIAHAGNDRRILQTYGLVGGSGGEGSFTLRCRGWMFHGQIPLLLTDPLADQAAWLDAKAKGDVYVEVTEGASLGNWRVVLDELEQHPVD